MNVPIWAAWVFVAVLAIASISIFTGKAPYLIAGYNTANKEEKSKSNIKALCKVTGSGLGVITIILALIAAYNDKLPSAISWLSPWGILGTIALMIILGNTLCRK